jgi:hypothetical protein
VLKILSAAVLLAATPAFAAHEGAAVTALTAPSAQQTFTRDGHTYVYTTQTKGDYVEVRGKAVDTNKPFQLFVRGNDVPGQFGDSTVAFRRDAQ